MAKKSEAVEAMVSGAGFLSDFFSLLLKEVKERDGTSEDVHRAVTKEGAGTMGKIAELLVGAKQFVGKVFQIVCDGSYTASELIKRGGYDSYNDWITDQRFPLRKHQPTTRQIEFVELSYNPSSEDVLREFKRRGLKRPTHEDALYFGPQHQDEQRKGPIVFLHKLVLGPGGRRRVLVLGGDAGGRLLGLDLFDGRWDRCYRFAGVRESR